MRYTSLRRALTPRYLSRFLLSALLGLSLGACETDFDANDAYHETTVVYAVLDPSAPRQTVRINKAYLNTGTDARVIAATRPDSITFPDGVIEASLEWLKADSSVAVSYPLIRTVVNTKLPGTFSSPEQVVYQTPDNMPLLNTGIDRKLPVDSIVSYRIRVLNKRTGQVTIAATSVPKRGKQIALDLTKTPPNQVVSEPLRITFAGSRSIGFTVPDTSTLDYFQPQTPTGVSFNTQPDAGLYRAEMDFHFQEIDGSVVRDRVLTWELINDQAISYASGTKYGVLFPRRAFFNQFLANLLDTSHDSPGLVRKVGYFVYRVTAASPPWAHYIEVLNSGSAILQTTPEYTNVRNGRGLVVGRATQQRRLQLPVLLDPTQPDSARKVFNRYPQYRFVF